ncbi:MAG: hypothetical protein ACFNNL_07135 [Kingella oralis]
MNASRCPKPCKHAQSSQNGLPDGFRQPEKPFWQNVFSSTRRAGQLKRNKGSLKTKWHAPPIFRLPIQRKSPMTLWQTIASAFLLLAVYIIIAIRCENRRVEQLRAQSLPAAQDAVKIRPDMRYQIKMSDGQMFDNVAIIGQIRGENNPFGGWDGLFVLRLPDNRRAFVRQSSVRYILETAAA